MANSAYPAGRPGSPVILMEFNELCPPLLDRWMADGALPHFARLHARSQVFTTLADVSDPAQLEPWIQWYSVHTGLAYDQHRVFHLTDGPHAGHPDIYKTLIAAGRRVGSFASMNLAPFAAEGSFYVADPWSENGDAFPPELNIYNAFVSHQVREYSNADAGLSLADQARFVTFLVRHGLSVETVAMIGRQLAAEKIGDTRLSYRRAAILDRIQYDVFRALYERNRPDFASFFINSTAHFQHSYWRHHDPEPFTVRPDKDEMAVYGDAMRYGYQAMDRLVGRFMALAERSGATLMFMTALSQQPFLRHEELGGQHFHRLRDVEGFLDRLGIARLSVEPTMTHQYMLRFGESAARNSARARIEALRLEDGRTLFGFDGRDDGQSETLYIGCQIATRTDPDTHVIDETDGTEYRFGDLLYRIEAIKSGRHHPEGALWIASGKGAVRDRPVSILDLFPTLTEWFGIAMAPSPRRGTSLVLTLDNFADRAAA